MKEVIPPHAFSHKVGEDRSQVIGHSYRHQTSQKLLWVFPRGQHSQGWSVDERTLMNTRDDHILLVKYAVAFRSVNCIKTSGGF